MPIYEYECKSCGERIEKFQKISDAPLTLCPNCGANSLEKLVSAAAFKLTGSGWYETDFKDKKPKSKAKKTTQKDTGKKTEKSSDKPGSNKTDTSKIKPTQQDSAAK